MQIPHRLKFALETWSEWSPNIKSRPVVLNELGGGKTNASWLLEANGERYVARLNNPISGLLGIDRKRERIIHSAVAKQGISPSYLYLHAPSDTSIFQYIEGECLTVCELAQPRYRAELLDLVDRYQKIKIDMPRFNYPYYLSRYWYKVQMVKPVLAKKHAAEWEDFLTRLDTFDRRSWVPVITHHDLEPANILKTHSGIKLIDWEYSGNGHPGFDGLYLHRDSHNQPAFMEEMVHWLSLLWNMLYEYGHGH